MKILLVDDERLVRLGLISMLDELYPGEHEYIEIKDGQQLIEEIHIYDVDMIFLDIHMPRLSGIEAYKKISHYEIPVIILTGYSEFEYARQALTLGASGYLLKPASIQEVKEAVEKVKGQIEDKRQHLYSKYGLEFSRVLDLYESIDFISSSTIFSPPFSMVLFYLDIRSSLAVKDAIKFLGQCIYQKMAKHNILYVSSLLNSGELYLFATTNLENEIIGEILEKYNKMDERVATAFLIQGDSLESLFAQMEQIKDKSSIRICTHFGKFLTPDQLEKNIHLLAVSEKLEEIALSYGANDKVALIKHIEVLAAKLEKASKISFSSMPCIQHFFKINTGTSLRIESLEAFKEDILNTKNVSNTHDMIAQVKVYVEKNYMNQIGINTISELLNISPNYLSRIYKNTTGENFTSYLTHVRVKKATILFKENPEMTIRAVAEKVGYFSTRHFVKVFMKHTGMLPSDYIKKCKIEKIQAE